MPPKLGLSFWELLTFEHRSSSGHLDHTHTGIGGISYKYPVKQKITWSDLKSNQDLAWRSMTKPLFLLDVAWRSEVLFKSLYALYSLALSIFL